MENIKIKPPGYGSFMDINTYDKLDLERKRLCKEWNADVIQQTSKYIDIFFSDKKYDNDTSNFLEIGTGVGFMTSHLLKKFPNLTYHSYEYNQTLSNSLKKAFASYNFFSHYSDGKSLSSTKDNSIDAIICFGIFTYLSNSNILSYFKEIYRTLKPNGIVFFDVFILYPNKASIKRFIEFFSDRPWFEETFMTKMLEELGFTYIKSYQENDIEFISKKYLFKKIIK